MTNSYTPRWFDLFMRPINPAQTEREVDFLCRNLPLPRYERILDVCCGVGRHSNALAHRGYSVVGVDRDGAALAEARQHAPANARFVAHDMRKLDELSLTSDAVLCLWQSFGYFDAATNRAILQHIADLLPVDGRFVLDIYHRGFFEQHAGTRTVDQHGTKVTETKHVDQGRLHVELIYEQPNLTERFEWELYTPEAICQVAHNVGFATLIQCTNYDEDQVPTADLPRMQFVFVKG